MQDNRTATKPPVLSVPGTSGSTEEKILWNRAIEGSAEASAFEHEFKTQVLPWLEMGDRMVGHINYCMLSIGSMKKETPTKEAMLARLRPVVALKEVIDLEVGSRAAELLNKLQKGQLR